MQQNTNIENINVLQLRSLPQYKESKRISLYLSTADEIDTVHFLKDIFESNREAFVPFYEGKIMKMVKLHSMEDYEKLPLTKWNIKQPAQKDVRDNALETGKERAIYSNTFFTINNTCVPMKKH